MTNSPPPPPSPHTHTPHHQTSTYLTHTHTHTHAICDGGAKTLSQIFKQHPHNHTKQR
ncbi:hypothetical protein OAV88_02065 [bacterium]|nr:hypothetical protein [bacterium]